MNRARPDVRRIRLEIDLELDGRVPLPESYIVEALAEALPEIDRQGLLFPGVDWPRSGERLRDWSVRLAGSGRQKGLPLPIEAAIEQRRREGDLGVRDASVTPAEAKLRALADDLLAAIDDLEPVVLERAKEAWRVVVRLRHMAARLGMPASSAAELRATIEEARELLATPTLTGAPSEGA